MPAPQIRLVHQATLDFRLKRGELFQRSDIEDYDAIGKRLAELERSGKQLEIDKKWRKMLRGSEIDEYENTLRKKPRRY